MIRLTDGPAADVALALKRAPFFLRVVQDASGQWDGLDQLDDQPKAGEAILVYVQTANQGSVHLLFGGKQRAQSGFYPMATYRLFEEQPDDATARSTPEWQRWCKEQAGKMGLKG